MLTERTQKAIGMLHEIAYYQSQSCPKGGSNPACTPACTTILSQLREAGFIRLLPDRSPDSVWSYELCVELSSISLYQLLIALGEGLNLISPAADEERIYKYYHYGAAASKLGVVNHMLRTLLCDISLLEL